MLNENTITEKNTESLSPDLREKFDRLKEYISSLNSLAVGYSGGVDSSLLLAAAHMVLKEKVIAVTCSMPAVTHEEIKEAAGFCKDMGVKWYTCAYDAFEEESFRYNPPDRCYACKKGIFNQITKVACEHDIKYVAEGSNTDDMKDYRPGMRALEELSVLSPLKEVGLSKSEIRHLSKTLKLPTWDKPANPCLATRIAYGEEITKEKLDMIEQAEQILKKYGFNEKRVRLHKGGIARVEVPDSDIEKLAGNELRNKIYRELIKIGFKYVTMDMEGFRSGSMNRYTALSSKASKGGSNKNQLYVNSEV